jgi:hypothetical protein
VSVIEALGSTETGGIAFRRPAQERRWTPFSGVKVDAGEGGRLLVHSPFVPDENTGYLAADRIERHEDGSFTHIGRIDDVVKVGAKRVSLRDLETRVGELLEVREARIIAVADPGLRGNVLSLVVESGALGLDAARVRAVLLEHLDRVIVPRRIRVVPSLPRTAAGKVTRASLLSLFAEQELGPSEALGFHFSRALQVEPSPGALEVEHLVHISADSPRFDGHFPGWPVLPGVAQLHDLVLPVVRRGFPELGRLKQLKRLKFKQVLHGGESVVVRASRGAAPGIVRFSLRRDEELGTLVAEGQLSFEVEGGVA